LMPPDSIPRTESGKVRRAALREAYEQGQVIGRTLSPKQQVGRLRRTAFAGWLRRARRQTSDWLYAQYWRGVVVSVGLVLWPLMIVLPRLSWRWRIMHAIARPSLSLLGHGLTVAKACAPPAHNVVYVVTHTSYMDHLPLAAVLPGDLAFVAYKGLADLPIQGPFSRAMGTLFVEQVETENAAAEVSRALDVLKSGRPIVIYPEGTILRGPGVLDFMMGGFVAAATAGAPVVPVTVVGARKILRNDHRWFPRRGDIEIHVGPLLRPEGSDFQAALKLRAAAREWMLAHTPEPDLGRQRAQFQPPGAAA